MSFENLQVGTDVEAPKDVLGGGGGYLLDSGAYPMQIEVAYLEKSKNGALGVTLRTNSSDDQGKNFRTTIWVTNRKGENFYVRNNKTHLLPGMELADGLSKILSGENLAAACASAEKKTIKLYNRDAGGEVNTEVPVLTSFTGQTFIAGIQKVRENKNVQGGDGTWKPGPEEYIHNNLSKVFDAESKLTPIEIAAGKTEPAFYERWVASNGPDDMVDKYKPVAGGPAAAQPAVPNPANTAGLDDLFKKNA